MGALSRGFSLNPKGIATYLTTKILILRLETGSSAPTESSVKALKNYLEFQFGSV